MLQNLNYELSVLAKAVQHKNLSAAAAHVGLGQPQLSRMVAKIEQELNIVLLDRTARRKSGWTQLAQDLAISYSKGTGRLESEILALIQNVEVNELRIGTLEGLNEIACDFAQTCFTDLHMRLVYLDVFDFADLDANFLSNNLDLIFTVRPPGRQKYRHLLEVGYQQMEKVSSDKATMVASPFEFTGMDKKSLSGASQALISNSLSVRRHWLKDIGGTGVLPTDAKTGKGRGQYTIYLLGSDLLSPRIWDRIEHLYR